MTDTRSGRRRRPAKTIALMALASTDREADVESDTPPPHRISQRPRCVICDQVPPCAHGTASGRWKQTDD